MKKWRFIIKPDGKVEVEGFDFQGSECITDIIYKLIKQNSIIEEETKHKSFGDDRPVENIHYVKGN